MRLRLVLPLSLAGLVLAPAAVAAAVPGAASVQPRPGAFLRGSIHFPRVQGMALLVDERDASRATLRLGFDGRCAGGGLGELWAAYIPAREAVKIRNGRFSARVTGATRDVDGVTGRDGAFRWALRGRFLDAHTATARVWGTANIRVGGRVVSRCRIARSTTVRLTIRG